MQRQRLKKICRLKPVAGGDPQFPWLWMGTWSMGGAGYGGADFRISRKCLDLAFEKGVRHFDTAGLYAKGESERLLKEQFSQVREKIFISTKGGLVWEGNRVVHRAAPKELERQLFESMDRLGTDYLDLFQLHWPDPKIPLDESLGALDEMKKRGLIRFWGAGNLSRRQTGKHFRAGDKVPVQVPFNPCRKPAMSVLGAGHGENRTINCIISPFEQGLLVNPHFTKTLPGKKDVRRRNPLFSCRPLRQVLREYFACMKRLAVSPAAFLLLWLLGFSEVDIIIPGPRTPVQVQEIFQHIRWLEKGGLHLQNLHGTMKRRFGPGPFQLLDQMEAAAAACFRGKT